MTQKLVVVDRLEWDCPCESCAIDDNSSWTWRGEYATESDGARVIEIICREDDSDYRHIQLPAGYALCKIEEEQ